MLFLEKREKLKIPLSKIVLTVHRVQRYFPRKGRKLKIPQSKVGLTVHWVLCYIRGKGKKLKIAHSKGSLTVPGTVLFSQQEENLSQPVKISINLTEGTIQFSL